MRDRIHPSSWLLIATLVITAPLAAQTPTLEAVATVPKDLADRAVLVELELERSFAIPDGGTLAFKAGSLELRARDGAVTKSVPWPWEFPRTVLRDSATGAWLLHAPTIIRELKSDLSLGSTFSFDTAGFGPFFELKGVASDAGNVAYSFTNYQYSGGSDPGESIEGATIRWKRSAPDAPTLIIDPPEWSTAEEYLPWVSDRVSLPVSPTPYLAPPALKAFERISGTKRVFMYRSWVDELFWSEASLYEPAQSAWKLDTRGASPLPAKGLTPSSAPLPPGSSVAISLSPLGDKRLSISWKLPDGSRGSGTLDFSEAPFAGLVDTRKTSLEDYHPDRWAYPGPDGFAYVGATDNDYPEGAWMLPTLSLETEDGALWLLAQAMQPGPMDENAYWEKRLLLADPSKSAKAKAWQASGGGYGPVLTRLIPKSSGEEVLIEYERFMAWGPGQSWLLTCSGSSDLLIRSFADGKVGEPWFSGSARRLAEIAGVFANRNGTRLLIIYRHGIADLYAVEPGKSLSWLRAVDLLEPAKPLPGAFDAAPFSGLPTAMISSGSNLRLRSAAGTSATVVGSLPFGTLVQELERGARSTIDGISAPWTRIRTATGQEGWVFGGYLAPAR